MNRQAMGPTIRLQTKLLPFSEGMDILVPGTILFTNVTLQTWITYKLFFVIDHALLPNERYVEDNRIGYFDFSPVATVSSDFYKFTFTDNILARMWHGYFYPPVLFSILLLAQHNAGGASR